LLGILLADRFDVLSEYIEARCSEEKAPELVNEQDVVDDEIA
jgi:hypothetical protein